MPPTEDELRAALQSAGPAGSIDVDAVLRRARRRRRPRVLLVGAAGVLAVAAIVVPVSISALGSGGFSAASGAADTAAAPESADASGTTDDSALATGTDIRRAPADKLNLCTGTLAEVAPAESGLVLSVDPVDAAATDTAIPATVTLTNTGAARVTGTTASSPALTFSRDGVTLWHSNGPQTMTAVAVDLEPGASLRYTTTFEPVVCSVDDDLADRFAPDLPAAGPGTYGLSAAIDLLTDAGVSELVTGPVTSITLR